MTDRDRLIELITKAYKEWRNNTNFDVSISEFTADHLLANGVIVPPCKVGDTVYTTLCYGVRDWRIEESVIVEIRKRLGFNLEITERITNNKGHCTYLPIVLENFGVTKFLTKEEAEAELRKRSEDNA